MELCNSSFIYLIICNFMIFLLSPASASLDASPLMKNMRTHGNSENDNMLNEFMKDGFLNMNKILNEGKIFDDKKHDFPGAPVSDEESLNLPDTGRIYRMMEQTDPIVSDSEQNGESNKPKVHKNNPINSFEKNDASAMMPIHEEGSPIVASPNSEIPSLDTPKSEETHTVSSSMKLRLKVSLTQNEQSNNVTSGSKNITPDKNKVENTEKESALKHMWTSSVPVLIRNNRASVHSKIDYNDISKVLPDLPTLLEKLQEVHKPGHVSVMLMDPHHLPVNREVVKKTKICCELRHILIHMKHSDHEPSPDYSSNMQDFPDNFIQTHLSSAEPESSEQDHYGLDDTDSPWNSDEKTLVSRIMSHLHLFEKPGHISAISFNPRHIVQKRQRTLFHIRIRIHIPSDSTSGNSGFGSPPVSPISGSSDEDTVNPVNFGDYNTANEAFEPSAEHTPEHFTQNHIHVKLRMNRKNALTMQEIPLNNILDHSHEGFPAPHPLQVPEAPRKTMFYFIIHHRHNEESPAQEPTSSSVPPNLQTLLRDIFNVPMHKDIPDQEFEPTNHEDSPEFTFPPHKLPEESFQGAKQLSPADILEKILNQHEQIEQPGLMSSGEHSADHSSDFVPYSDYVPLLQNYPLQSEEVKGPKSSSEGLPDLPIFRLSNTNGRFGHNQFSPSMDENPISEEPSEDVFPSHGRIIHLRRSAPISNEELYNNWMG